MTTATNTPAKLAPFKMERGVKYRDAAKTSVIQVRNIDPDQVRQKSTVLKTGCVVTAYTQCVKKLLALTCTNASTTARQPL